MIRKVASVGFIVLGIAWILLYREPTMQSEHQTSLRDNLITYLTTPAEEYFSQVVPGRAFVFPQDHGPHPDFRQEWWYFTGRLEDTDGRIFGYQLTFFRFGSKVVEQAADSAWSSDQTWMAHLAVTDTEGRRFFSQEDFARGVLGLAGASDDSLHVWVNGWSVSSDQKPDVCPGCFTARLEAAGDEVALELIITANLPPVLQGDNGYSIKSADGRAASYYYSMPGLITQGTIHFGEKSFSVRGESWVDREWSSAVLALGQSGWDWFALNLSHDVRLMLFRVRESGKPPFISATMLQNGTHKTMLAPERIQLTPIRNWTSPNQDATYPVEWKMQGETAEGHWSITVYPVLDHQELDLTVRYYEGLVAVEGVWNGIPVSGWGYMELTGYLVR